MEVCKSGYGCGLGYVRVGMELGWGGFDRAKLDMLLLIRIPFSFYGILKYSECTRIHPGPKIIIYTLGQILCVFGVHDYHLDCSYSVLLMCKPCPKVFFSTVQ